MLSLTRIRNNPDQIKAGLEAKNESIDEIILALSASVEGSTTAHYIQDNLKGLNVKISKLAQGIPVGGEIEFLDDGTLFSAFKNRALITKD